MPVDIRINFENHRIASDIQKSKPNGGGSVSSWVVPSDYHLTLAHSHATLSPAEQKILKEIVGHHVGNAESIPISVASSGYRNDPNPMDFGRSESFAKLHISDQGITKLQNALITELNQKIPGKNFSVANPPHITIAKQSSKFSEQEKSDLLSVAKTLKGLSYGTVTTVECAVGSHVDAYTLGSKKGSTISTPTAAKNGLSPTTKPSGKTEAEVKSSHDNEPSKSTTGVYTQILQKGDQVRPLKILHTEYKDRFSFMFETEAHALAYALTFGFNKGDIMFERYGDQRVPVISATTKEFSEKFNKFNLNVKIESDNPAILAQMPIIHVNRSGLPEEVAEDTIKFRGYSLPTSQSTSSSLLTGYNIQNQPSKLDTSADTKTAQETKVVSEYFNTEPFTTAKGVSITLLVFQNQQQAEYFRDILLTNNIFDKRFKKNITPKTTGSYVGYSFGVSKEEMNAINNIMEVLNAEMETQFPSSPKVRPQNL